jgi:hypothetical protein
MNEEKKTINQPLAFVEVGVMPYSRSSSRIRPGRWTVTRTSTSRS